jgi:hypothetical protein
MDDERDADRALLAQVAQQLALRKSAIEREVTPLPRARAPHATVEIDDEVTNIVARPTSKPL